MVVCDCPMYGRKHCRHAKAAGCCDVPFDFLEFSILQCRRYSRETGKPFQDPNSFALVPPCRGHLA